MGSGRQENGHSADDRQALKQLCRHIARPALANERVQCNAAGQVVLKLKTPWHDDTTDARAGGAIGSGRARRGIAARCLRAGLCASQAGARPMATFQRGASIVTR